MLLTDLVIRKISIGISIIGIVALLLFSAHFEPKEVLIENISQDQIGQEVVVKGIVKSVFFTKNTLLFEIFDSKKIKAVKFSPSAKEFELIKESNFLEITGKIQKYRGELEIVVKEVKKLG